MGILADTNILLRMVQPDHPQQTVSASAMTRIVESGETVYFTLQNVAEFWNVATRPIANNGLGLSVEFTRVKIEELERDLTLLPDVPAIYAEWKRLVVTHSVLGTKVHDARLVAAMKVHGVGRILTFNGADFARFEVEVVHPSSVSG